MQPRKDGENRPGYFTNYDQMEVDTVLYRADTPGVGLMLSRPERVEVVARLTEMAWSAREIAITLGTTERSVVRYRSRARERSNT